MAEQNLNIGITSSGSPEATAGLDAIIQKFGGLKAASADVQQEFGKPFQHAGLYMFSRQILGLAGLGDVARHSMMAITAGMESVAGAAGVTLAALAPYLLAIGVGIVVFEKWHKSHKDQAEVMAELAKKQGELLDSTTGLVEKLEKYDSVVGSLPPHLAALLKAEQDLQRVQSGNVAETIAKQIEMARQKLATDREQLTVAQENLRVATAISQNGSTGFIGQKNFEDAEKARKAVNKLTADIIAQKEAIAKGQAELDAYATSHKNLNKALDDGITAAKDRAKAQEILDAATLAQSASVSQLASKEITSLAEIDAAQQSSIFKKIARIDVSQAKELESIQKIVAARERGIAKEQTDEETKAKMIAQIEAEGARARVLVNEAAAAKSSQAWAEFFGAQQTLVAVGMESAKSAFSGLSNAVGQSFASMIVDGKNFFESFDAAMKNLARSFIAAVTEMMIKWAAFKLLTGVMGGAALGFDGAAMGGGSFMGLPGMNASGFEGVVDRPTTFMAGDGGLERVSITPLNSGGGGPSGGASGGTSIGSVSVAVSVHGVTDPDAIADKVGLAIVKKIRGTGQLNFLRTA